MKRSCTLTRDTTPLNRNAINKHFKITMNTKKTRMNFGTSSGTKLKMMIKVKTIIDIKTMIEMKMNTMIDQHL